MVDYRLDFEEMPFEPFKPSYSRRMLLAHQTATSKAIIRAIGQNRKVSSMAYSTKKTKMAISILMGLVLAGLKVLSGRPVMD